MPMPSPYSPESRRRGAGFIDLGEGDVEIGCATRRIGDFRPVIDLLAGQDARLGSLEGPARQLVALGIEQRRAQQRRVDHVTGRVLDLAADLEHARSEEHPSALQSLMSISYAVFCLKKKKIAPDAQH